MNANLQRNLSNLLEKIEIERLKYSSHQIIKLVAVSKYTSVQNIIDLYNIGHRSFGENKVQDLKQKIEQTYNLPIQWHMIGTLQENKINQLLSLKPYLFQALDSLNLANALQKRLERDNQTLSCLLQINSSDELTKSGFRIEEAIASYKIIKDSCKNINLKGIMSIGANTSDTKIIESCFKKTKDIFDTLTSSGAEIFSCGMSGDFEIAIANGANMLRIGSSIFKN